MRYLFIAIATLFFLNSCEKVKNTEYLISIVNDSESEIFISHSNLSSDTLIRICDNANNNVSCDLTLYTSYYENQIIQDLTTSELEQHIYGLKIYTINGIDTSYVPDNQLISDNWVYSYSEDYVNGRHWYILTINSDDLN